MNRGRAFTLVEMLVATALAAALMLAVLGVTASVGRTAERFDREDTAAWSRALVTLLRDDLRHADEVAFRGRGEEAGLEIRGRFGIDAGTARTRHTPTRVTYQVLESDGLRVLVREEEDLMLLNNRNRHREPIALDVQELLIEPIEETAESETDAAPPAPSPPIRSSPSTRSGPPPRVPTPARGGASTSETTQPLPTRVRLQLTMDDPRFNLDEVIVVR